MREPDLGVWLADPVLRTRHESEAPVEPLVLWHAAESVRLDDTRTLGRLVRWRIPDLPEDVTFRDLFRSAPFTVLDEGDGWSLSGLVGRIWTRDRDYPRLASPEAFRDWDEPDTARVLMANWVERDVDGAILMSEARATGTDDESRSRLRTLWTLVSPFERLIGGEALALAARRATEAAEGADPG